MKSIIITGYSSDDVESQFNFFIKSNKIKVKHVSYSTSTIIDRNGNGKNYIESIEHHILIIYRSTFLVWLIKKFSRK